MQNNQNHAISKCQMHGFSIKSIQKDRRPNLNASATMCKAKQTKNKKNREKCNNYQGPIFNKDRCHATPAFILPSEKVEYVQSVREFIRDHDKRVREYDEQPEQLYIAKPRSKNMYCNVCRQNYQEYLDHIKSSSHRFNGRTSIYNGFILDLQEKFKSKHSKEQLLGLNQAGSRTDSDEVEIIGVKGRKRVKTNDQQRAAMYSFNPSLNMETNQQYTLTGSTQNLFYPPMVHNPYKFEGFNSAKNMFHPYGNPFGMSGFYPYFNQVSVPFGYPMYCMPYQPFNIQVLQQH